MKGVPGVIQLESKWLSLAFSAGSHRPLASSSAIVVKYLSIEINKCRFGNVSYKSNPSNFNQSIISKEAVLCLCEDRQQARMV